MTMKAEHMTRAVRGRDRFNVVVHQTLINVLIHPHINKSRYLYQYTFINIFCTGITNM